MKKVIFYDKGYAETGKSNSVKAVFRELANRAPKNDVHIQEGSPAIDVNADVKGVIKYRGANIAIESQGDPSSRQPDSIREFAEATCSIIVCACRTKGETHDVVMDIAMQYDYAVFAAPHFCIKDLPDDTYPRLNSDYAHQVVRWIDWWIDNM